MSSPKDATSLPADAKTMFEEAQQMRSAAQVLIDEALSVRKSIDSEALLAHNAKQACEGHATEIAKVKGNAEADYNGLATFKQQAAEAVASITASRAAGDVDIKVISDSRRTAEDRLGEIVDLATKLQSRFTEVEAQRIEIDEAQQEAHTLLGKASAFQEKAETGASRVQKVEEKANGHYSQVVDKQASITELATEAETAATAIRKLDTDCKSIVGRLKESDARTQQLEEQLHTFLEQIEGLKKQAEDLLPGVTSAGLASAFNAQRQRFLIPQRNWLIVFLVCIFLLVCVAAPSFIGALYPSDTSDWGQLLRSMLLRLPIALPLIWLAIYAGRNYMLSVRIEEDYAFKEAVSRAFEGYKREMMSLSADASDTTPPLITLCTNILTVIGDRPGRLYDGKQTAHSLPEEFREILEKQSKLADRKISV